MRRILQTLTVATVLSLAASSVAQATPPISMSSSMNARCLGTCQVVRFELYLNSSGGDFINQLTLISNRDIGSPWTFLSFSRVWDAQGTVLFDENSSNNLWTQINLQSTSDLAIQGTGTSAATPLYVDVRMSTWGSASTDLDVGFLDYGAIGFDANGNAIKTGGTVTVTPEPLTMLLLGTGLAGMAGVAARRRRKKDLTE